MSQFQSPALVGCSVCDNPAALRNYIDAAMPPGGTAAAQLCSGDCAINVSAYVIAEFNRAPDLGQCNSATATPSPSVFKRLSRQEYAATLKGLMQLQQPPNVTAIPDDPSVHNFKTVASVQGVQVSHLNGYISVATEQAESLMGSAERRDAVLGCDYTDESCLDSFISAFGRLAFRRPLTAEEIERISQFSFSNSVSNRDQFVLAMQLLLTSPNFIYRVEVGDNSEGLSTLNAYELASRLAFSLWGSGPSSELLDQAERGMLDSAEGLRQVAEEMLTDERAKTNLTHFFEQWLATNLLAEPVEKPANWYSGIFEDMRAETNTLLSEYAWQDKNFLGVLTENRTYLTPELAQFYGLPAPPTDGAPFTLPAGPRADTGILSHAANLFAKSDGDLVAIRGNWLRSTFLCNELQLPSSVAEIIDGKFAGFSPTEIIAARNADAACERCHSQIDPIGIAFAPFNRIGLFDQSVNLADFPISPGFPDAADPSVQSVKEIAHALAQMPEVGACLADRLFLYSRNHEPEAADHCTVHQAGQSFEQSGYRFASLLMSMVEDPSFRVRVAPEPIEPTEEQQVVHNIAEGKPVSTTAAQSGNPGSRLTDGDTATEGRWAAQFYPQQATIDLGALYSIVQTEVYPYMDRPYQYTIEASSDGNSYRLIVDRSASSQGGNVISNLFAPVDARYVRITLTGLSGSNYEWIALREVKIFGSAK